MFRVRLIMPAVLALVACAPASEPERSPAATPAAVVAELLAADRGFAAASARTDAVSGLSAMFAADVTVPVPGNGFTDGAPRTVEALRSNPEHTGARLEWDPVRGGVSADGRHGFTFGYMTQHQADGTRVPLKYLAYWVRQPEGWRVVVYRRARRAEGEVALESMPPALPPRMVVPSNDTAATARFRESLDGAERAFSRDAQRIGLGAAFARYGSEDAVNMGGPDAPEFVVGAEAIGRAIGGDGPATGSPVSWAPDRVIVASSGDLGVTIGMIRPNAPAAGDGGNTGFPFFTIWRRASVNEPWRYVAE